MAKNRVVYALLLVGAGIGYVITNQSLTLIILGFLCIIPVFTGIMLFCGAKSVTCDCKLEQSCVVYQPIGVKLIKKSSPFAILGKCKLWITYENLLFQDEHVQCMLLEPGNKNQEIYTIPYESHCCGKIKIHFKKTICYDLLGLFKKKVSNGESYEFTVFPETADIQTDLKNMPSSVFTGDYYNENKKGNDINEVYDMRDYSQGDSMRSIHWKLSAKLDRIIVREFGQPSNFHTLILYQVEQPKENDYTLANTVLGAAISISKSLLQQTHAHHVGCMCKGNFMDWIVEDNRTYIQLVTNMMSTGVAAKEGDSSVQEFLRQNNQAPFTKIILVTEKFEPAAKELADYVDLTVVQVLKGEVNALRQDEGYKLIAIPSEGFKDKIQVLEI